MITQLDLQEYFTYNENTGIFIVKKSRTGDNKNKIGDIIGTRHNKGYLHKQILGKKYLLHRLAWLYVYGYMPKFIDHINHDKTDNRLQNLREATKQENSQNKPKQKTNTSGVSGVQWYKDCSRWVAFINVDKKRMYLGCFASYSDAVDARKNAEVLYGYHENHGKD